MFTAVSQKNKATAKAYFDEHLSLNDYYSQGELKVGRWIGIGAERLGLVEGQAVNKEAFMRLCDNADPGTGELLTQRLNPERRVFFDFTCSAPKSVSIMAVTMDDERIVKAHQLASRFALKELERFAGTRIRKDGSQEDRSTGNLIGAEFLHNSSRALDPQLHTHFTLFNATYDSTEQRWKALQTSEMFGTIHYATEVYRNELAKRLHALGYETVRTADAFEIKGVSQSLCDRFSKRSKECDSVVKEMEQRLGRKISNNEVSHAVHQTRSRKLKGITTNEVRQRQLNQITSEELQNLRVVQHRANGFGAPIEPNLDETLQYACAHVFERSSVVTEEAILQHALIEGRGGVDLQKLKEKVQSSPEFLRVGREYSTREILEGELYLIDRMNSGQNSFQPLARCGEFSISDKLGPDQRKALELLLHSPDQFTGIRGLAGTGKSTALTELCRAIRQAGCEPVVCAPTGSTTDVLRKDGFEAITLQKLLVDPKLKAGLHPHSVLVLDEAGAVGIDDMRKFFSLTVDSGARAILSGDTGQHASVARGDALRILEKHSRYCFGQLTQIRRQRQSEYRKVVELAANQKPLEAFQRLDDLGAVFEAENTARLYQKAAEAYLNALDRQRSALLVSPTWAEIDALTDQVRSTLQTMGRIGTNEVVHKVLDSLSWTDAQKCNFARYQPGQVLLFHQDSGKFKQHQTATVVSVEKSSLQIRLENGTLQAFRPRSGTAFDVCQARELKIAPGDKLLLQANHKGPSGTLVNGELVEVKNIENGHIKLTDGRTLPLNYRRFCHGYAVTSHASQGKTVDDVFLVASSRSFGAVTREQFYVSISRGRERCQIFTDDKELLSNRIGRSQERKAAIELAEAMRKIGLPVKDPVGDLPPKPVVKPSISPARVIELARLFQQFTTKIKQAIAVAQQAAIRFQHTPHQQQKQSRGYRI